MTRVSSNFTLFFRIFLPIFYVVFYGAFTITLLLEDEGAGIISEPWVRWSNLAAFMATILIIYLTIWQLKRVEFTEDFIYVTDYFKTYRYSWPSVKRMTRTRLLFVTLVHIHFRQSTSFGNSVTFLLERRRFRKFLSEHPDLAALVDY